MVEWYYSEFGQMKGPVSEHKLLDKVLKQELEPDSYVMKSGEQVWKKVSDYPELEEKLHRPEAIPHGEVFDPGFFKAGMSKQQGNIYFYIPIRRLILMSILTGGLYQLYWFYKQWRCWAVKHKQAYRSADRVLGNIFLGLMVFEKIETDKDLNAVERADFNGTLLFWTWVTFGFVISIVYSTLFPSSGSFLYVTGVLSIIDVIFLLPIQKYINRVNEKLGNNYDKPSFGHYLCLVIVWIPLLLVVYGMLFSSAASIFQGR